jgi:hypothetical protein
VTFLVRLSLILVVSLSAAACGSRTLPEADTAAAKNYVTACAGCHVIYPPKMFTAAMWGVIVDRMDLAMRRRGRPMTDATRAEVLDYLQRNAGER